MFLSTILTTALALSTSVLALPANKDNNGNANGHDKDKKNQSNNGTCPLSAVDPVEFPYPSERASFRIAVTRTARLTSLSLVRQTRSMETSS